MSAHLPWLPTLVVFNSYNGDWDLYEAALYAVFMTDFVHSKPTFRGKRLGLKRHPVSQGKEATFWHLISEGANEADRTPDMRRCERIGWPRPGIDNCDAQNVKVWEAQRRGERAS
jgi:hypothetical protein